MKVNIWSDVRCPFCYIGKRKFEMALEKFSHKDKVEVEWHSFQLDPHLKTTTEVNAIDHISEIKGISHDQAVQMHQHVTQVANEVGLNFEFDKVIVANSFNAHRLIQLAKNRGLGSEIEEQLFKAHFIEGKNIDDNEVLVSTGISVGLSEKEIKQVLFSDAFSEEVKQDEMKAQSIGVRGVPFFVLNDKYAVSGAQSPETFLEVLEQTWTDYEKENKTFITTEVDSCSTDGSCN